MKSKAPKYAKMVDRFYITNVIKNKCNKIQMEQNINAKKYKWNKIQIEHNAKIPK